MLTDAGDQGVSDEEVGGRGKRGKGHIIQALDRGLVVLEALAAEPSDAPLSHLASQFPWDKSTTRRLLTTLIRRGLVEQDGESHRYRLGLGILKLSSALHRRLDIRERSRSLLRELTDQTRETSHLGILHGDEVVVVEQAETAERIRTITYVGMRMPIHCTALGKALLAFVPDSELRLQLGDSGLRKYTDATITDPNRLEQDLAEIRRRGYAYESGEFDPGMSCLASPVRDSEGHVVAVVGVSGPSNRIRPQNAGQVAEAVVASAERVSERMGYIRHADDT